MPFGIGCLSVMDGIKATFKDIFDVYLMTVVRAGQVINLWVIKNPDPRITNLQLWLDMFVVSYPT